MINHTNNDLAMIQVAEFAEMDVATIRKVFRAISIKGFAVIDERELARKNAVELFPISNVMGGK